MKNRWTLVLLLLFAVLIPACASPQSSMFEMPEWNYDEVFEPTDDESWLLNGGQERFEAQMEFFAERFGRDEDEHILWPEEVGYVFNSNAFIVIALTDYRTSVAQKYMDMVSEPERLRFTRAIHKQGEPEAAVEYLSSPECRADAQAKGVTFYEQPMYLWVYASGTLPVSVYVPESCYEAAVEYFGQSTYSHVINVQVGEWLNDLTVPDSWTEMSLSDWAALYTY